MSSIEEHKKTVEQMEDDIIKKIRENEIFDKQKIVGFACSEGSTNAFAILLHKENLIPAGFNVNHRWFSSEKIARKKFPYEFTSKDTLIFKLVEEEKMRNKICYGKQKPIEEVEKATKIFFEIKELIEKIIGEKI